MSCSRTYENYDENEYFLKFHNIHPILMYSTNKYDLQKKELQITLLNKLNDKLIDEDTLKNIYNDLIKLEIKYKNILNKIQYEHKEIENNIKINNEKNLINFILFINEQSF
jgi:hypothetical protein